MRRTSDGNVKWKIGLLLAGLLLFLGLVILNHYRSAREREEYQELLEEKKEEQEAGGVTAEPKRLPEETPDSEPEEAEADEEKLVDITNLEAFATPVMGMYDELLTESLDEWMQEQMIEAGTAEILQAVVPKDDPQVTEFYVRMGDAEQSLAKLVWHPRERIVTTSESIYTETELMEEPWGDNGPRHRDLTPEEEEALLLEKEQEELEEQRRLQEEQRQQQQEEEVYGSQ